MNLHWNVGLQWSNSRQDKCAASGCRTRLDSYAAAPGLRSLLGRLYVRPFFVFDRTLLSRRRVVGQDQGVMRTHSPCWNRCIGIAEAIEHFNLFTSGHQPQNTPSTIDDRVGQCHSTSSLVDVGQRDICAGDTEDRISRNQRGSVAIAAEAQNEPDQVREVSRQSHKEFVRTAAQRLPDPTRPPAWRRFAQTSAACSPASLPASE
jgi:hypothetical protein